MNWPGPLLSPSLRQAGPQAPLRCSSFCFYLGVMYDGAICNLSTLIQKYSLSNRGPPSPQFQNSLASRQDRVTRKSERVLREGLEGQKSRGKPQKGRWVHLGR